MGKENEKELSVPLNVFDHVTQIRKYYHLIGLCDLVDNLGTARVYKRAALKKGMEIVTLVEKDEERKEELDKALNWLRKRDYEMYGNVSNVLEQAQALRAVTRDMMRMNGKKH